MGRKIKWAVIQVGEILFGKGRTKEEAIKSASRFLVNKNTGERYSDLEELEGNLVYCGKEYSDLYDTKDLTGTLILTDNPDIIGEYF